jgi:murein DD-endopeptidase MepM/ murein hydrolase activator NlpD
VSNRIYTVLIVPERSSKVRRLRIPHRRLMQLSVIVLALVGVASYMGVNYLHIVDEASQNRGLKEENLNLKDRLRKVQDSLARIDGTLQRIDKFSAKVRTITRLNDPERNLAIGPLQESPDAATPEVMYSPGERIEYEDELPDSKVALRLIESKIEAYESQALAQDSNMRELHEYFANDGTLLANTPSIRPIGSNLLNSGFTRRKDPYTGQWVMHKGVDFAAQMGDDVFATADGVVVFAGNRGKYGKTLVVDHGFGLQTHYAHLSGMKVDVGAQIKRGQVIGAAGNTGLTTGVHLHYEVRFNGIPQDPEHYLLD